MRFLDRSTVGWTATMWFAAALALAFMAWGCA